MEDIIGSSNADRLMYNNNTGILNWLYRQLIVRISCLDYSDLPLNILGQICIPFSIIWFFISGIGIVMDDYIRYIFFKEEKPKYFLLISKERN